MTRGKERHQLVHQFFVRESARLESHFEYIVLVAIDSLFLQLALPLVIDQRPAVSLDDIGSVVDVGVSFETTNGQLKLQDTEPAYGRARTTLAGRKMPATARMRPVRPGLKSDLYV